jgi:alkanesulfonate monooxygenase SsuD/methylene tetrahydromethanopterin reductase-like flavin-dependent oxidoreductase (luciferase family)
MIMAASTAESIEWCARHRVPMACSFAPTDSMAENFAYYRRYSEKECGWTPTPDYFMFSRQTYVAETDAKAREEAEQHLYEFWREIPIGRKLPEAVERYRAAQRTDRSFEYKKGKSAGGQFLVESLSAGKVPDLDWLIEQGLTIFGSPETVVKQIRHQQERFGAGTMLMYTPFGTLPVDLATRSIELFAKEVLPQLKQGT